MDCYIPNWSHPGIKITEGLAKSIGLLLTDKLSVHTSPAGSFLLRQSVLKRPSMTKVCQPPTVICPSFDMAITMNPEHHCNHDSLKNGEYLERRSEFVDLLVATLKLDTSAVLSSLQTEVGQYYSGKFELDFCIQRRPWRSDYCSDVVEVSFTVVVDKVPECTIVGGIVLLPRPGSVTKRINSAKTLASSPTYAYAMLRDFNILGLFTTMCNLITTQSNEKYNRLIVILKCWLVHAGFTTDTLVHKSYGSFPLGITHSFTWALVLHLIEKGVIHSNLSVDTMVRLAWIHIASNQWEKRAQGVVQHPELYISPTCYLNIFHSVNPVIITHYLKNSAEKALQYKNYGDVFIQTAFVPSILLYDFFFTIESTVPIYLLGTDEDVSEAGYSPLMKQWSYQRKQCCVLSGILSKGLESKCRHITVVPSFCSTRLFIGACAINSTNKDCNQGVNLVVKGPSITAEDSVEEFKQFWGTGLTSARQFSDGSVHQCVVVDPSQAHLDLLSAHLPSGKRGRNHSKQHYMASPLSCLVTGTQTITVPLATELFAFILMHKYWSDDVKIKNPTSHELNQFTEEICTYDTHFRCADTTAISHRRILETANRIQVLFSDISDDDQPSKLPFKIQQFNVLSEVYRGTAVHYPKAHILLLSSDYLGVLASGKSSKYPEGLQAYTKVEPIDSVVVIKPNANIPENLEAVRKFKTAVLAHLFTHLSTIITEKNRAVQSQDIEHHDQFIYCTLSKDSIYLITSGYVFQLFIGYYPEIELLERQSENAEATAINRKLFVGIQHTEYIVRIASQYQTYTTSVRIARKWVALALLSDYLPLEAIELMVAYVHLKSESVLQTTTKAFYLFLELLAKYPWRDHPLILPGCESNTHTLPNDKHTEYNVASPQFIYRSIYDQFTKVQAGKGVAMYIAAPYDSTSLYTTQTPKYQILMHLVHTATNALDYLYSANTNESFLMPHGDLSPLFDIHAHFNYTKLPVPPRLDMSYTHIYTECNLFKSSPSGLSSLVDCANTGQNYQLSPDSTKRLFYMISFDPFKFIIIALRSKLRTMGLVMYNPLYPHLIGFILLHKHPKPAVLKHIATIIKQIGGDALTTPTICNNIVKSMSNNKNNTHSI